MPHECIGGCGRTTGDDDPNSECPDCRDELEKQEEAAEPVATEDEIKFCGPCRVCAPMDRESCHIKRERERRASADQWWKESR